MCSMLGGYLQVNMFGWSAHFSDGLCVAFEFLPKLPAGGRELPLVTLHHCATPMSVVPW